MTVLNAVGTVSPQMKVRASCSKYLANNRGVLGAMGRIMGGQGSAPALISLTQNLCPSRQEKDACKLTHNWTR